MSTILIAEDDLHVASLVALALVRRGHEVLHAPDGARALELATTRSPDLILLDLMMPVLTGMEVLAELRSGSPKGRAPCAAPVIILSGRVRAVDVQAGFDAGAADYLTKPFSVSELVSRTEMVLRAASSGSRPTR